MSEETAEYHVSTKAESIPKMAKQMNNEVMSEIRSLYRDDNDLLRTITKRIYEHWDAEQEQWCLQKIEFIYEDPEFPVPSANPAVAVEQRIPVWLVPPDWEFVSEVWEYGRKPESETVYEHEDDDEVRIIRE